MINMVQVIDKDKARIKDGYIDKNSNIERFIFLKNNNYEFNKINLKDITRVCKHGNFAIYMYNGIYFEVGIYASGCYMSFDNIMGNWLAIETNSGTKLNKKMFDGYSTPKIAIKNYIQALIEYMEAKA